MIYLLLAVQILKSKSKCHNWFGNSMWSNWTPQPPCLHSDTNKNHQL